MSVQRVAGIRSGDGLGDFIAFTSDAVSARSSSREDEVQRGGGSPGGKGGSTGGGTPKGGSSGGRSGGNH